MYAHWGLPAESVQSAPISQPWFKPQGPVGALDEHDRAHQHLCSERPLISMPINLDQIAVARLLAPRHHPAYLDVTNLIPWAAIATAAASRPVGGRLVILVDARIAGVDQLWMTC